VTEQLVGELLGLAVLGLSTQFPIAKLLARSATFSDVPLANPQRGGRLRISARHVVDEAVGIEDHAVIASLASVARNFSPTVASGS
jgi:hypothetical protein